MEIDAIGTTLNTNQSEAVNSIDLESFLRLFITQLTYQDPLEPTTNEEFLAQMAQFAGLDQQRQLTESMTSSLSMSSSSQSISLLGKNVQFASDTATDFGEVTAIRFGDEGPELTVTLPNDRGVITSVKLSQIDLVQDAEN